MCAFTKFVKLVPLRDTTAETVAQAIVETFFSLGLPFHLVSDNGPQYRAKLMAEINKLLGVRHIFISAYHSQANSNVERMCGVVKSMISTALDRTQREWHMFLGASQFAVNSTTQSTNKWSPAFLMFGRHFRLPIEQALGAEPSPLSAEREDLVSQLRERQFDAITQVIRNQKASRAYQRERYNLRAKDRSFEIGDRVYLYRPATKPGNAAKLSKKWEPGFIVVGSHDNGLTFDVRKPGSKKPPEKVHSNRLKPQPASQVYREGQAAAKTFRRAYLAAEPEPGRPPAQSTRTSDSGSEGQDDMTDVVLPRRRYDTRRRYETTSDRPTSDVGPDSGVTSVLEALGTGPLSYSASEEDDRLEAEGSLRATEEEETDDGSEDDSDERYATIPLRPAVAPPSRPRRTRRPPDRYSPSP